MSGLGASKSDLADARSSSLAAQLGQSQPKPQHVREYERLEANKMRAAMAEADREAWLRMSYEENDEYAAYLVAESGDYANGGAGKMGPALWRSERQRRERENEEEVSPWLTRGRELYNQRSAARNGRNKAMALGSKLRLEIAQLESARSRRPERTR